MLEQEEVKQYERLAASLCDRVSSDDMEALQQMKRIVWLYSFAFRVAVQRMHGDPNANGETIEHPYSWTEIGNALGMTRQAAAKRFGRVG